jgi:hypothetical protein
MRKRDERLAVLDTPLTTLKSSDINNFTGIYAELLSIAEYLGQSSDASRLIDALEAVRPETEPEEGHPPSARFQAP